MLDIDDYAAYNLQVVHVTSLSVLEVTISLDGLRIDKYSLHVDLSIHAQLICKLCVAYNLARFT